MKSTASCCIVYVTVPTRTVARRIAETALNRRAAACVNVVPNIESHYWWNGKLEKGKELLLIFKTLRKRLPDLENCVRSEHPYDTPEFVVLPIHGGSEKYLQWIHASVQPVDTRAVEPRKSRRSP